MEHIKETFAQCRSEKRAALVTYVTAGYPTADETLDILLGMEAGGAGGCARTPYSCINWTYYRPHWAWSPLHRSNCRRTYDTKVEYTSIEEWHHRGIDIRDGTESEAAGFKSAGAVHGLLQSTIELWGKKGSEGRKGSWSRWLHCCWSTTWGSSHI